MYKVNYIWVTALLLCSPLSALGQSDSVDTKRSGPIQIEADSGEYDNRVSAYKLFGNVRIQHGNLSVRAEEGFAYQTEGEDERVELTGSPTEWTMEMADGSVATGQSDQIIYNLTRNIITMIGNARVEDRRGIFTGARLTYNLETERTEGEGGVRVVIDPSKPQN